MMTSNDWYFISNVDWTDLLYTIGDRLKSLYTWKFISKYQTAQHKINNLEMINIMKQLQDKWLDYMILWMNNDSVVTRNYKWVRRSLWWYYVSSNFIWWTRGVSQHIFNWIHDIVARHGKLSVWRLEDFCLFMTFCLVNNLILSKSETKKYKQYISKWWERPILKAEKNLLISFLKNVEYLTYSMEDEDQIKLNDLFDRYKMDEVYDLLQLYNTNESEFNEKISCIWKENNYKILATLVV